jgi:hypothetical protein
VGGDVGRPHSALWGTPGQSMPHHSWAVQAARTVCVGQPCGFRPVDGVLNKNHFLFISNSIQIQNLEIHISLLIAPKIMKSVPSDFMIYPIKLITKNIFLESVFVKLE